VDPAISQYLQAPGLAVFQVTQARHHADYRVQRGERHADARLALQRHQAAQEQPAVYLWQDEIGLPGVPRMLAHRGGTDPSERVHARECEVTQVPLEDARAFYNAWHLQGACKHLGSTLGLLRHGKPVAMMSFTDPRACRGLPVPWMLHRYACSGRVPGAASKLLAAFRRGHTGSIVSYSDNRYSPAGGLYRVLGFSLKFETGPDYRYWRDGRWYAKSSKQRKHLIAELGGCTPEDTEFTMASRAGYQRCYDCGKKTWVLS